MGQMNRVGKHATTIENDSEELRVTYHETDVVTVDHGSNTVILDTGGYKTYTTKARMNQASNEFNLGFRVYQKNSEWFVSFPNDDRDDLPFGDSESVTFSLTDSQNHGAMDSGESKQPTQNREEMAATSDMQRKNYAFDSYLDRYPKSRAYGESVRGMVWSKFRQVDLGTIKDVDSLLWKLFQAYGEYVAANTSGSLAIHTFFPNTVGMFRRCYEGRASAYERDIVNGVALQQRVSRAIMDS